MQPPNQRFSLSAKINGTQRRVPEECIKRAAVCQTGSSDIKQ